MSHHWSGRDSTPDPAAQITQRLSAAMDAGHFHRPGGRSCIETGLAKALQDAAEIRAAKTQRQQIGRAGKRATEQSRQEGELPAAAIRQRPGKQTAHQRHKRKDADYETNGLIRAPEIAPDMRRQGRQHCPDTEESKKRCSNEGPETPAEPLDRKPHFYPLYFDT